MRGCAQRISAIPHDFLRVRSKRPNALPTARGQAEDAFHVVVPSLPGFGCRQSGKSYWNAERTASAWVVLMERLGYKRYVAQGGDWKLI
jgi:hypothetical protein